MKLKNTIHRAVLWESVLQKKVLCNACSHRCTIAEGHYGICGVRKNHEGILYSTVYEFPIAINVDPIEKKPLFHVLPGSKALSIGTAGCNFTCAFCQNFDISQLRGNAIRGQKTSVRQLLETAITNHCQSIAYTYNEPVVFLEFVLDTATAAHQHGLKNIYVSNGFETAETLKLLEGKIDAMNIDLKAFRDDFYKKLCRGRLRPVLETIKRAYEAGIELEITTLLIPGQNDSDNEIREIARFIASIDREIPWHISRFFPTYRMQSSHPTPVAKMEQAQAIGKQEGLQYVYLGNIPHEQNTSSCPQCGLQLIVRNAYQVSQNILELGKCPRCGYRIKGIFKT